MVRKILTLFLSLALCLSISAPALAAETTFRDVPADYWAYNAIEQAYKDGVINGTGGQKFSPEAGLTLAHFVAIMTRGFYNSEVVASKASGTWYAKNLAVANNHGLMKGLGSYQMNATATRYQMAVIAANIMEDQGSKIPSANDIATANKTIADYSSIPVSYRKAVATVFHLGIIRSVDANGTFSGSGTMKRSHAAVIYGRLLDAIDIMAENDKIVRGNTNLILSRGGTLLPDGDPESYVIVNGVRYKQYVTKNSTAEISYRFDEYAVGNKNILQAYQKNRLSELVDGEYPKNSKGESYGPDSLAQYVGYYPDLMSVTTINGKTGYVGFNVPREDHFRGLSEDECSREVLIPVCDSEGNKIGEMPLGCGGHELERS